MLGVVKPGFHPRPPLVGIPFNEVIRNAIDKSSILGEAEVVTGGGVAGLFLHGRRPRFDEQDCLDGTLIKRVDLAAFEEVGKPLEERILLRAHGVDSIAVFVLGVLAVEEAISGGAATFVVSQPAGVDAKSNGRHQ